MSVASNEPTPILSSASSPRPAAGRLRVVRPGASYDLPPVVGAGLRVPTLTGEVEYANLDHAASTPSFVCVKNAVDTALQTYSSVHRGNGYASRVTSAWYEQARDEVAAFVGAREDDLVVFTRNTTDSFNLLSRVLPRGTEVFVFETEHHSTLLPWRGHQVTTLPVPSSVDAGLEDLKDALSRSAARTRLVVIAGASNVTGEIWPLRRVVRLARKYGARVAVDAAQLAPHRAVDIAASDVDYVAFSGHKIYAPFGAGVLAGRADWLDQGAPYLRGGGATSRVTTDGATWATGPARHEGGSPNVIGAIALAAACAAISASRPAVEAHERALLDSLRTGLDAIPGVDSWSIFGEEPETADRVAVLPFTIERLDSSLVSAILSAEYGIGVRDGKFCAHILVDELLEDPWGEVPATAVRVSIGLANTQEHVDRLVAAVATLAAHGPSRRYSRSESGWVADDDTRDELPARPW